MFSRIFTSNKSVINYKKISFWKYIFMICKSNDVIFGITTFDFSGTKLLHISGIFGTKLY